jgi:hydroxypyruvate reductase
LAADTDGIDGVCPFAGAWLTPETLQQARAAGAVPLRALDDNDALAVFEPLGQVIQTGPTRTNVNDFRAILIT